MATPERKTPEPPRQEEHAFLSLLEFVKTDYLIHTTTRIPDTRWGGIDRGYWLTDAIVASRTQLGIPPDEFFRLVSKNTIVDPNNVRAIVGGASEWPSFERFHTSVGTEILEMDMLQRFPELKEEDSKRRTPR